MATPEKRRNWLVWALVVSLGVNLIVLGLVAGAAWRFAGGPEADRQGPHGGQAYGAAFVRALPDDARRALHRSLREGPEELPSRAERRAQYARLIEVLRRDPFEPAAVQAIFDAQGVSAQRIRDRAQRGWLDIVEAMSPEARAEVADRLEEGMMRREERRGDR